MISKTWLYAIPVLTLISITCSAMAMSDAERAQYKEQMRLDNMKLEGHELFIQAYEDLRQGKNDEAAEKIDRGLKLDPNNENAIYNKGVIYQSERRFSDAADLYVSIINRNPKSDVADYSRAALRNISTIPEAGIYVEYEKNSLAVRGNAEASSDINNTNP